MKLFVDTISSYDKTLLYMELSTLFTSLMMHVIAAMILSCAWHNSESKVRLKAAFLMLIGGFIYPLTSGVIFSRH
ncbi:hypothetical protein HZS_3188 [Henneguya salminicola]|nr:hypothetical protein HZS_3188 [Henneguya salminicola]